MCSFLEREFHPRHRLTIRDEKNKARDTRYISVKIFSVNPTLFSENSDVKADERAAHSNINFRARASSVRFESRERNSPASIGKACPNPQSLAAMRFLMNSGRASENQYSNSGGKIIYFHIYIYRHQPMLLQLRKLQLRVAPDNHGAFPRASKTRRTSSSLFSISPIHTVIYPAPIASTPT